MTDEPALVFEPFANDALARLVEDHLFSGMAARTGISDWHPVGWFLRNERGEWLGGLVGYIWGGWLHVKYLWVSESLRGRGHGTRLMDAAEAMALERGATSATLETFTFQAPEFYRKRGYEVFGRLDGYPPDHAKLFLRKRLLAGSEPQEG